MIDNTAIRNKSNSKSLNDEITLSKKIWAVLASDLQNPDAKAYAQSVLRRAMKTKKNDYKQGSVAPKPKRQPTS
jgi:hypothetical protein